MELHQGLFLLRAKSGVLASEGAMASGRSG